MINTNEVVGKLYKACVLRIKQQPEIQTLSDTDQVLLYIFLGLYGKENELTSEQQDRLKTYNRAIANNLMVLPPEVAQDIEVFEKVENADVFYRCAMEQCAVATGILNGDSNTAIEYLNISPRRKKSICTAVEEELSTFGAEHFWMKYQKYDLWEETVIDDNAEDSSDVHHEDKHTNPLGARVEADASEYLNAEQIEDIAQNEKRIYENRVLDITGSIRCAGELKFVNCIIRYGIMDKFASRLYCRCESLHICKLNDQTQEWKTDQRIWHLSWII